MPKTKQVTFSGSGITAVATYTFDADEIVVSGETVQLSPFWASSATVKLTVSGSGAIQASVGGYYTFSLLNGYKHKAFDALWNGGNWGSWSNGATSSMQITNKNSSTFSTRYFFDETNKTERRIPFTYSSTGAFAEAYNDSGTYIAGTAPHTLDLGQYLVLDAPPTFEATNLYYDGDKLYTGFSRVYCDISDCTAFYGGDIESATLKVGNQSATISGDGTVYIDLAVAGTFTPTVAVTDSRGQVTTKTLDAITVNGYIEPSLSLNVQRTTSTGVPNDEGTYGTMSATFTFTDVIAQLTQPTVEVDGTTASVTWYSTRATDGTLSGSVNWSSLTSPATVYGIVSAPNIQTSYQIEVTPNDSLSSGTPITQTLASAFYTVDFLAGGHGIAFGQPSSEEGFFCNMEATFHQDVNISIDDESTDPTDIDYKLYRALLDKGWI